MKRTQKDEKTDWHSIRSSFGIEEMELIDKACKLDHGSSRARFMKVAAMQRAERIVFGKTKTPD